MPQVTESSWTQEELNKTLTVNRRADIIRALRSLTDQLENTDEQVNVTVRIWYKPGIDGKPAYVGQKIVIEVGEQLAEETSKP